MSTNQVILDGITFDADDFLADGGYGYLTDVVVNSVSYDRFIALFVAGMRDLGKSMVTTATGSINLSTVAVNDAVSVTLAANRPYRLGAFVHLSDTTTPGKYVTILVSADCTGTTLSGTVQNKGGSGTITAFNVSISAKPGVDGTNGTNGTNGTDFTYTFRRLSNADGAVALAHKDVACYDFSDGACQGVLPSTTEAVLAILMGGGTVNSTNKLTLSCAIGDTIFAGDNAAPVAGDTVEITAPFKELRLYRKPGRLRWAPNYKDADITISEAGIRAAMPSTGTAVGAALGTIGFLHTIAKIYFEIEIVAQVGTAASTVSVGVGTISSTVTNPGGTDSTTRMYACDGQKVSSAASGYGNSWTTGDIIGIAIDNGKIWFAKNNIWQNSGDPVAGTNAAFTDLSGTYYPMMKDANSTNNAYLDVRFKDPNSLTYTPPTGFRSFNQGEWR